MRAGDAAVEVLAGAGVRRFYTVPGESFLEVLDAAGHRDDLTLVSTRHESGASFMAEAEAKLTGVPAVAMATRGVGASNLAIGVHTACQDSTPMVVLLGQVETPFLGREAFQEVDLPDFYREITKWSATVHRPDRLPEMLEKAIRVATSGRPGPVMLALPADVLGEEIGSPQTTENFQPPRPAPSETGTRDLLARLAAAKRPVAVAGELARGAEGEFVAFSERFGVGVYAAFRRQDRFPNDHPNYLGHLALGTPKATLRAIEDADLVISVGSRMDEVTSQSYALPKKGQGFALVHPDPSIGLGCDVRETLRALLAAAPDSPPGRDWSEGHAAYLASSEAPESRSASGPGVDPARVIEALGRVLPDDAIVANDAGNFAGFLHRYYRYTRPGTQLAPANGAMGYGLPAAVAAKLARPDRTAVSVSGDGGFLMTAQELETAVRHGLSLTAVVLRNGIHGTIAMHQTREMGRAAGTDIGDVDLAAFAASLGARGVTVRSEGEIEDALRGAVASGGVTLVDVATDPDLISPEARLSEMGGIRSGGGR